MARILAVCKDTGGTHGLLPVAKELRVMGHEVVLVASGIRSKAVAALMVANEQFFVFPTPEGVLEEFGYPQALVTDMSTGGGIGRDLMAMLPHTCATFALQDYWGGCLMNEWHDPKFRPGNIVVGDEIGAVAVRKAWPEYCGECIAMTGYPALDKYARPEKILAEAEDCKKEFGLGFVPTVLYAGGAHGGHCLMELVEAIKLTGRKVNLVLRPHPRMKDEEPGEALQWDAAVKDLVSIKEGEAIHNVILPSRANWSTSALIAAAREGGVVVSAFSTCLLEATVLGVPNITYWDAPVVETWMSAEGGLGGLLDEFPLVTLGCTAKAENVKRLAELLNLSFAEQLGLREAQERHYPNDGLSARRAAEFIHARILES